MRLLVALAERSFPGGLIARKFLKDIGVAAMRAEPASESPAWEPLTVLAAPVAADGSPATGSDIAAGPAERSGSFPFETVSAFAAAYRDGTTTPEVVAERVLAWARESDAALPPLRVFIAQDPGDVMEQARASTARFRAGRSLGPLDGVPIAVKDELDQRPYPTTVGTRFRGGSRCEADAEAVARLRTAGAILIGKANMHEIGLGVTGVNPHHGAVRNPYDPARATGGSSSGPAAAVAAGFCPASLGADGGGSIRIPASLCGVVGLKPTFGRVSERGAAPLCWSVAHIGPLAASARDAALVYSVIAGPDPADPHTTRQPPVTLDGWGRDDLKGVRIGIDSNWFDDADPPVVAACRGVVDGLRDSGAEIVPIEISGLALLRTVHLVTIVTEMLAAEMQHRRRDPRLYAYDTRLNFALASRLTNADYVHAQRHRARLCAIFADILEKVDAIATPATTCTAPVIPAKAIETGESDLALVDRIMRNCPAANVTGLPAISFPAGYDEGGLPIGLQMIGRAWREHVLLRIAAVAETLVDRRPPRVHRRLLGT